MATLDPTQRMAELERDLGITSRYSGLNRDFVTNVQPGAPKQNFLANVGRSVVGGLKALPGIAVRSVTDITNRAANNIGSDISLQARLRSAQQVQASNEALRLRAHKDLAAGKISKARFRAIMKDLANDQSMDLSTPTLGERFKTGAEAAGLIATAAAPALKAGSLTNLVAGEGRIANAARAGLTGVEEGLGVGKLAGKSALGKAVLGPAGKLVRNAVVQQDIDLAAQVPGELKKGNFVGAAGRTAALASPIAIAKGAKYLPKAGEAIRTALHGKGAGPIVETFGKAVQNAAPEVRKALQEAESFTLSQPDVKKGLVSATQKFQEYLKDTLKLDVKNLTPEEFAQRWKEFSEPTKKLQALRNAGKIGGPGKTPVLSADFRKAIPDVSMALKANVSGFDNVQTRLGVVRDALRGLKNPTIESQLIDRVANTGNVDEAIQALKDFSTKAILKTPGFKPPKGFVVTYGPKEIATIAKAPADLQAGKAALPGLKQVGNFLRKIGLGVEEESPQVYGKFKANLDNALAGVGLKANQVTDALQGYIDTQGRAGTYDFRQLSPEAIRQALNLPTVSAAKDVQKAIFNSYSKMTFGDLGLYGKVQNALFKVPGYKSFSKLQSRLRYEQNPLFRLQENIETEVFAQAHVSGKTVRVPYLMNQATKDRLAPVVRQLENSGLFKGAGYGAEGAEQIGIGISARLAPAQKYSIADMVEKMAQQRNTAVPDLLKSLNPKELDAIRAIVQYPRTGFLSSNFAKGLNLFVWPVRYKAKLLQLSAKALAKQPAAVQIATVKGIADLNHFLNSDAGIKWQSENSEALGILKYLNPLAPLQETLEALRTKSVGVGDIGLIGGLPLGMVTEIIQHQTGVRLNRPYLNPKTGEVVAEKLPANTTGRVKMVLIDLINHMYSFPGRRLGFNISKGDLTQSLPGLKLQKGEVKYEKPDTPLTGYEQRVQRVLSKPSAAPKLKTNFQFKKAAPMNPLNLVTAKKSTRQKRVKTVPASLRIR